MAKIEVTSAEHAAAKQYQKQMLALGVKMSIKKCYVAVETEKNAIKNMRIGRIF